ncbi:Oxoglutarate iron-dependent oxygenase [Pleurostoma richardsiae]|uniref:Oxoglutarate iron-dependent oxygenase n=1 Tax=Pleurostoma richardsiae TaxID=41990 RepID=A0AA38R490_9PEZI|nr:Oxoglutarate iron-dependent oxygenase [Pleurostoma richardsiae]
MASWHSLPKELRDLVFGFVQESAASKKSKTHPLASCAVVCREWQGIFERANFRSLQMIPDELHMLDTVVKGPRRRYLRHFWLRVQLPKYSRDLVHVPESEEEQEANSLAFGTSVWAVFDILSKWQVEELEMDRTWPGIELEISVSSPSDKRRMLGEAGLDDYGGSRFLDSEVDMLLDEVPELLGTQGLPEVHVVSRFSILRRNFRSISPRATLILLLSLPRVKQTFLEPWSHFDPEDSRVRAEELSFQLALWPPTLRKVTIFENVANFKMSDEDVMDLKERCPLLGRNLARLSLQLEDLSVSRVADAKHFFAPFLKPSLRPPLPQWKSLRCLTLSSTLISPEEDHDKTNELLRGAGSAAKCMPVLRIMELYSAESRDGGLFRYVVGETMTLAKWESTWEFKVSDRVKDTWREVSHKHTRRDLVFYPEALVSNYRSPVKFIHHNLATVGNVLHPISSQDMVRRRGNRSTLWPDKPATDSTNVVLQPDYAASLSALSRLMGSGKPTV